MKIIYDGATQTYVVKMEDNECVHVIRGDNIVDARELFIENIASLFDLAVNKKLQERQI